MDPSDGSGWSAALGNGERRCPSCGGLAGLDDEWCGQCYAPLGRPVSAPATPAQRDERSTGRTTGEVVAVSTPGGGALEVVGRTASWDCPVCGERNALEAAVCSVCATPFGRLFETPSPTASVAPSTARRWSLVFPGLGHWRAGFRADALARIVLFAWTFGTVLLVVLSRSGRGLGSFVPLFALYLAAALGLYVLSAVDAGRMAEGRPPVVSTRALSWASAGLVVLSIVIALTVALPAAHG